MTIHGVKFEHVGLRYSEYSVHDGVVYLAGQVASAKDCRDIKGQTREVLGRVEDLLLEAGSSKGRILSCQIFMADIGQIGMMNEVWDSWIVVGSPPPRATVEASLASPDYLIEVVVTAAIG